MINKYFWLLFIFVFSSCASVLNGPNKTIYLRSKQPIQVTIADSTFAVKKRKTIRVPRTSDTLRLRIKQDTTETEVKIPARLSEWYWSNVFNFGIGFIRDAKTDKRFTYKYFVQLDREVAKARTPKRFETLKGDWELGFSLPSINAFYFQPESQRTTSSVGFFGIAATGAYHYHDTKFLSLTAGAITDFPIPVPASYNREVPYTAQAAVFVGAAHHHEWNRFSMGYGINYSYHSWKETLDRSTPGDIDATRVERFVHTSNLGVLVNGYYRVSQHFNLGVVYRPTFIKLNAVNTSQYEHTISLDLLWKWRISKD